MYATLSLLISLLLAAAAQATHSFSTKPCITVADSNAAGLMYDIDRIVTGTDSVMSRLRTHLFLPYATAEEVTTVTADSTCHQALVGLGVTDSTATAYVLQVGSAAYVVRFPPEQGGVYFYTLDSTFALKGIMGF
jgi:hypothetical protein